MKHHLSHRAFALTIAAFLLLAAPAIAQTTAPIDHPGPRWGHAFVYDPVRDVILLFGGAAGRGAYLGDTWTWDGESWTRHEGDDPSPRGFVAAAFDPQRQTIVIHGGRGEDNQTLSDTWQFDVDGWRCVEGGDADEAFAADHHAMVHDPVGERLIAFGGWNSHEGDVQGVTWQLTVEGDWEPVPDLDVQPPPRGAFGMAYDNARRCIVLFGGLWVEGQYADLWEFDGAQWARLGGTYDRSSLDHHHMVYDAVRERVVVFGGKNYRRIMQGRTMQFDGKTLSVLDATGPRARHSIGLAYDSRRERVVLYGGKIYEGEAQLPLGDIWMLEGEAWTQVDTANEAESPAP